MKDATGSFAGGLFGLALVCPGRGGGLRALPAHPQPDTIGGAKGGGAGAVTDFISSLGAHPAKITAHTAPGQLE
jgi:hypothetical protein